MERVSSTFELHSKTTLKALGAIERAYEDFIKTKITRTGVMIHYLTQDVDQGTPIITQEVVMKSGDRLEDLQERVHAVEHELIVKGIKIALERRLAT